MSPAGAKMLRRTPGWKKLYEQDNLDRADTLKAEEGRGREAGQSQDSRSGQDDPELPLECLGYAGEGIAVDLSCYRVVAIRDTDQGTLDSFGWRHLGFADWISVSCR